LRDDDREPVPGQRLLAIAEFRCDIDVYRQPRQPLEPVFADEAGIEGRAAGGDRQAVDPSEVDALDRPGAAGGEIEIMRQRAADDLRLLRG